jgi:hypothetical protein
VVGFLRYRGTSEVGPRHSIECWKVQISPDASLPFIKAQDFDGLSFSGDVYEDDATGSHSENPSFRLVELSDALSYPGRMFLMNLLDPNFSDWFLSAALSSDGSKMIVLGSPYYHVSTNSGVLWSQILNSHILSQCRFTNIPGVVFGMRQYYNQITIYKSVDNGLSFTLQQVTPWISADYPAYAISMDGVIQYLASDIGIQKSVDSGVTFIQLPNLPHSYNSVIACDDSGSILYFYKNDVNKVYVSLDGGNSYSLVWNVTQDLSNLVVSQDGSHAWMGNRNYQVYSSDFGVSVAPVNIVSTSGYTYGMAMDKTGRYLVATSYPGVGTLLTSLDYGASFTNQIPLGNYAAYSVWMSKDGNAIISGGSYNTVAIGSWQ